MKNTLTISALRLLAQTAGAQGEWMTTGQEEATLSRYLDLDIDYAKLAEEYDAAMRFERRRDCKTLAFN